MLIATALADPILLPQVWLLPVSALIPIMIAAATHESAPSSYRQLLSWVSVLVVAALEQITSPLGFTLEGLLVAMATAGVVQLGAYLSTNRMVDINSKVLPGRGIGAGKATALSFE